MIARLIPRTVKQCIPKVWNVPSYPQVRRYRPIIFLRFTVLREESKSLVHAMLTKLTGNEQTTIVKTENQTLRLFVYCVTKNKRSVLNKLVFNERRDIFREELQAAMKFQNLWSNLRKQIRVVFKTALKVSRSPDTLESQQEIFPLIDMHDTVTQWVSDVI